MESKRCFFVAHLKKNDASQPDLNPLWGGDTGIPSLGGWNQRVSNVHPNTWGHDPIWIAHMIRICFNNMGGSTNT